MSFFRKHGVVNVKMVITEEKILSNIDKVQRLINPASKKQIVELEEDSYFKDLIDSIKTYLIEYPKKKNFPVSVYKSAYDLVEFATNQFEENTKKVEELIKQREENISLASELKELYDTVVNKEDSWKELVEQSREHFSEDVVDTLSTIGRSKSEESDNYKDGTKLITAKINNLEKNLHIEIEMERIEDRSKALSYIGIEIAEALKQIPVPVNYAEYIEEQKLKAELEGNKESINETKKEMVLPNVVEENINIQAAKDGSDGGKVISNASAFDNNVSKSQILEKVLENGVDKNYEDETRFEVKPGLWTRFKNSKFVKAIGSLLRFKIVVQGPDALPEGNNTNK